MTPKQKANSALRSVVNEFDRLDARVARQALDYLREMRDRLQLAMTSAEGFNADRIRQLTASVDQLITGYESQLLALSRSTLKAGAELGALALTEPLTAAGIGIGWFQPTPLQLETLIDFSADLIKGITAETRQMINSQIRLSALGQRSTISAMQAVNERLGIPVRGNNVQGGVAYKGERIIRTEVGRAYNMANNEQMKLTARYEPQLRKSWIATGDKRTRRSHLVAHMTYAENPIPIDEPFIVGGVQLMYPLDPAGPPQETINCRCRMVAVHPGIGRIGGPEDRRIRKEMERRAQEE